MAQLTPVHGSVNTGTWASIWFKIMPPGSMAFRAGGHAGGTHAHGKKICIFVLKIRIFDTKTNIFDTKASLFGATPVFGRATASGVA